MQWMQECYGQEAKRVTRNAIEYLDRLWLWCGQCALLPARRRIAQPRLTLLEHGYLPLLFYILIRVQFKAILCHT